MIAPEVSPVIVAASSAPLIVMVMLWVELSDAVRVNESVRVSPAFRALTVVLELSRV